MSTHFSVIKYVPDPIADERINIGMLFFNEVSIVPVFLADWGRVKAFAMEDVEFLQTFRDRMIEANLEGKLFPGDEDDGRSRVDRVRVASRAWLNSIQFTEPRGSLAPIEQLQIGLPPLYLHG